MTTTLEPPISPLPPTLERMREFIGSCVQARQSVGSGGGATFGVLHLSGRFDERRGKAGPIGANGVDFGFDRPPLLLGLAQRVFNAAELHFLVRTLLIAGRRGIRRGRVGERVASPEPGGQDGYPRGICPCSPSVHSGHGSSNLGNI